MTEVPPIVQEFEVATTMPAVYFTEYGGQPEYGELPRVRAAGPGELTIAVAGASLNPYDVKAIDGKLASRIGELEFPFIPGCDVSGIVVAVGDPDSGFAVGQKVFGMGFPNPPGTFAQYATVPVEGIAPMPEGLSFERAAAIPLVGMTVWQAFEAAGGVKGKTVLIHGFGGVGSTAVYLARTMRASEVFVTASNKNKRHALNLGANQLNIDNFEDDMKYFPADVVLDTIGDDPAYDGQPQNVLDRSFHVLYPGGVVVSLRVPKVADRVPDNAPEGVRGEYVLVKPNAKDLLEVSRHVEAVVQHRVPFAKAKRAFDLMQARDKRGKIVLVP